LAIAIILLKQGDDVFDGRVERIRAVDFFGDLFGALGDGLRSGGFGKGGGIRRSERGQLTPAKLAMTFTGNQFRAEDQIEKALSDVGASKLYRDVKANAEMLLGRAEEMLWPAGGDRRVLWRDVVSRALTNERWPWLPPKGLDELRKIAEGTGRWKYSEEGYVEKGPFPKPRTRVLLGERNYKEDSGTAVLEILAKDAGPHGRVHVATEPGVSADSPAVPDTIFETNETVLWFLAVDPDGTHETGDPLRWENKLTLTHERITLPGGKRRVELTVKPRGVIRWNTTGANAKEGTIYSGPIDLPGDAETIIYTFAEDHGVGASRSFTIPRADQAGPSIDKSRSARLHKKLDFRGSTDTFAAIVQFEGLEVKLASGVVLSVGEGSAAITTRFGSDATINAGDLRSFIEAGRNALQNPMADVLLRIEGLQFHSGHDLETFLEKQKLDAAAGEVEQ
jgi:hypothetical protein